MYRVRQALCQSQNIIYILPPLAIWTGLLRFHNTKIYFSFSFLCYTVLLLIHNVTVITTVRPCVGIESMVKSSHIYSCLVLDLDLDMPCLEQSKKKILIIHSFVLCIYYITLIFRGCLLLRRGMCRSEYQSAESARAWAAKNSLANERRNVSVCLLGQDKYYACISTFPQCSSTGRAC